MAGERKEFSGGPHRVVRSDGMDSEKNRTGDQTLVDGTYRPAVVASPVEGFPGPFRRGVKALISQGGDVLLVKERHSDGAQFWTLPGGGVRAGESRQTALKREMSEELRCRVRTDGAVTSFSYVHTSRPYTVSWYTVIRCELRSKPRPNREEGILEYTWSDPEAVPKGTLPEVVDVLGAVIR